MTNHSLHSNDRALLKLRLFLAKLGIYKNDPKFFPWKDLIRFTTRMNNSYRRKRSPENDV